MFAYVRWNDNVCKGGKMIEPKICPLCGGKIERFGGDYGCVNPKCALYYTALSKRYFNLLDSQISAIKKSAKAEVFADLRKFNHML